MGTLWRARALPNRTWLTSCGPESRLAVNKDPKCYEQTRQLIENKDERFREPVKPLKTHALMRISRQLIDNTWLDSCRIAVLLMPSDLRHACAAGQTSSQSSKRRLHQESSCRAKDSYKDPRGSSMTRSSREHRSKSCAAICLAPPASTSTAHQQCSRWSRTL